MSSVIADLRIVPRFAGIVADRIWREWWAPHGAVLGDVEQALGNCLAETAMPFTLVAHDGSRFLGTVTGVDSDLPERPQYSPWIAALWVEPKYRGKGLGEVLMRETEARLLGLGSDAIYLCAKPRLRNYYEVHGWQLIEEGVGVTSLDVWHRLALPRRA